jgi:two-component system chemotaxis response regulator CheB
MGNRDVLAIGASAGGIEALLHLAKHFDPGLPASVFVTIHRSPDFRSSLDELLTRVGPLPAGFAIDGERYKKGRIYIAPADRHLLVDSDRIVLGSGPRENNARPAIDPMLRSIALCCGRRAIGVVLTGTLEDGASGLWAVDCSGGMTVVQDPDDAAFAEMPSNALRKVQPDHIAGLAEMPTLLTNLAHQPAGEAGPVPDSIAFEVEIARGESSHVDRMDRMDQVGRRSVFACPDCNGVMWEIDEGNLVRYRCHIGHAYTAERMNVGLDESLRRALATALRTLEDRVALAQRLQRQAEHQQQRLMAANWAKRAAETEKELTTIRQAMRRIEQIGVRHPTNAGEME